MVDVKKMQNIWKKQLDFVKAIAEDIIANNGSKAVLEHAAGYAHIEAPISFKGRSDESTDDFIRINWGEAYAYINYKDDSNDLESDISWNNDEMGISSPACITYEGSAKALKEMTEVPALDYEYDDVDAEEYNLPYEKFAA